MSLTNILIYGRAILGDGGSSDAVKPIFDADLTYLEEFDQMHYSDAGEGQLVEGTFYMVTLGDSVYAAKAKRLVDEEYPDWVALYLGNAAIEDMGVDSGEPFFYVEQTTPEYGSERIFSTTNGVSHVTITKTETSDNGLKTVTFDGSIDGKETFSAELIFQSGIFVKVLDSVVAADELQELIVTIDADDGAISNNIKENLIYAREEAAPNVVAGFWVDPNGKMLMVCFPSDVDMGEGIITAGTYVLYDENYAGFGVGYVSALTYGNSAGGSDDSGSNSNFIWKTIAPTDILKNPIILDLEDGRFVKVAEAINFVALNDRAWLGTWCYHPAGAGESEIVAFSMFMGDGMATINDGGDTLICNPSGDPIAFNIPNELSAVVGLESGGLFLNSNIIDMEYYPFMISLPFLET